VKTSALECNTVAIVNTNKNVFVTDGRQISAFFQNDYMEVKVIYKCPEQFVLFWCILCSRIYRF